MKKIVITTLAILLTLGVYAGERKRGEKRPKEDKKERVTYMPALFYGDKQAKKLKIKRNKRKPFLKKAKRNKRTFRDGTCTSPKKMHRYAPTKKHRRSF